VESNAVKIVVIDDKKIAKVVELQNNAKTPVTLDALDHGKYLIAEDGTGVAPENLTTKRVGDDLYVSFEGSDTDHPQVIIHNYYLNDGELVGKGEDGLYYSYVTANGQPSAALPADAAEPLALGDDAIPGLADGLVADDSNPDLMWALAGLGLLALVGGGIAIANSGGGGDSHHSDSSNGGSGGNDADGGNGGSGGDDANGGNGGDDANGGNGGDDANGGNGGDGTSTVSAGTLDAITDNAGSITGAIENNGVTDDNTPTFSGSGVEPGNTVMVKDETGAVVGSTTANADGSWTYTPDSPIADGAHDFSVVVVDSEGNESEPSNDINVVIDTVAPGPSDLAATDDNGKAITTDQPTNDATPTFSGNNAEPGSTIIISDGGKEIGTATVDDNGAWNFTPEKPLDDGAHDISVVVVDEAGNVSPATDLPITIDTVPPAATDAIATDDAGNLIDNSGATSDSTPTFSGDNAEPGSTIIISDGGKEIGTAVVDDNGAWNFTPEKPLDDGAHDISVVVVDEAGNTSPATDLPVTIDTTPPAGTDVIATDDAGNPIDNGGATNDTTPTFSGDDAEPGSKVIITDGGEEIGTVIVDENGDWNFTPENPLDEGDHDIDVVVVDDAGNTSPATDFPITIDTTTPDPAASLILYDDFGESTGKINDGDITDDASPTYTGNAEAGSTVIISDNGEQIGVVTANTDGTWAFTPPKPLADGAHSFSSVVVDKAGNESTASDAINFTIDVPPVPVISGAENFESVPTHVFDTVGDSLTLDNGLTVTFVSGPTDGQGSNSFTEISDKGMYYFGPDGFGERALMLVASSETHIDFGGQTTAVSFDVNVSSFYGSVVNFYDADGGLLKQLDFPVETSDSEVVNLSWTAPEGEFISSMSMVMTNGQGTNVITRVDNLQWGDDVTSTVSDVHSIDTHTQPLDYSAFSDVSDLDVAAASQLHHNSIEVQGHETLTYDQLLSEAGKDIFIADGKEQVAITGEEGSHVTLQADSSNWHENGQVTAGGVHYDVYQQQDSSLELLVQHGVELQHG
jgi:hypothetical protein